MVRDFTYIDDIVEGVTRVIDNPPFSAKSSLHDSARELATDADSSSKHIDSLNKTTAPYKIYNIGNSSPIQLLDFIKAIEKALGKKAKMNMLGMQPGDVPKTHSDVTDLVNDLGYKPDTTIEYGVEKFIEWYKAFIKK